MLLSWYIRCPFHFVKVIIGRLLKQRCASTQDPIYQTIFKVSYFVLQPQFTGPLMLRLAFHDAATWNRTSTVNKGGCASALSHGSSSSSVSACNAMQAKLLNAKLQQGERLDSPGVHVAFERRPAALRLPAGLGEPRSMLPA